MRIDRSTTFFFDASVLVAGAYSPGSGSALVLRTCIVAGFRAQITSAVIMECARTLEDFAPASMDRFHNLLTDIDWMLLSVPAEETLKGYERCVHPKDAHVLAAAVEGGAEFLLTLDRRHLLAACPAVEEAELPIIILTPGDFIQRYYPLHAEFPDLPAPRRA